MDKPEAKEILAGELSKYRHQSFTELQKLLTEVVVCERVGLSGTKYQLEVQAVWDGQPGDALRVSCCIDDGGFRAFFPVCDDFIIGPDGTFIGES